MLIKFSKGTSLGPTTDNLGDKAKIKNYSDRWGRCFEKVE